MPHVGWSQAPRWTQIYRVRPHVEQIWYGCLMIEYWCMPHDWAGLPCKEAPRWMKAGPTLDEVDCWYNYRVTFLLDYCYSISVNEWSRRSEQKHVILLLLHSVIWALVDNWSVMKGLIAFIFVLTSSLVVMRRSMGHWVPLGRDHGVSWCNSYEL